MATIGLHSPVDEWFVLDEILPSESRYVFFMRGKVKTHGQRVVLKCHLVFPFVEDGVHYLKGELSMYERAVYRHAVPELENPDLFVRYVGSTTRRYNFKTLDEVSAKDMGPADAALLEWGRRFPFRKAEDLNHGINILMTVDEGKVSAKDFIVKTRVLKSRLAEFIVQIVSAVDMLAEKNVVHGDLRWSNVMYPSAAIEPLYFNLGTRFFEKEVRDEHCVRVSRVVKVFDWDNAFYPEMPSYVNRLVYQSYHASHKTNMNKIYDKIGFLRLLHKYFPTVFFDDKDAATMEPAFSRYAYKDKRDGRILYQISQKGDGDEEWPEIETISSAVNAVIQKVYYEACKTLIDKRKLKTRERFELAVEGDNIEALRKYLSYPHFKDLNLASFLLLREFVNKRIKHDSGRRDTFYGGVALVMEGAAEEDARKGLELMGAADFPLDKIESLRKAMRI